MKKETISVVIPAFNAAQTIDRALSSVLRQEDPPDEVIVIDDGSSDQTVQVAKNHLINEKIPTIVISKINQGVSSARNLGILTASSKYIALLDADDEYRESHLKLIQEAIKEYPNATLYFSAIERFFDNDSEICRTERKNLPDFSKIALKHWPSENNSIYGILNSTLFEDLLRGNFIPTSVAVFKKYKNEKLVKFKLGLSYGEDRDFFIRLIYGGSALFINEIGGIIHRDGSNVSSLSNSVKNNSRKLESLIEMSNIGFVKNNDKYSLIVQSCIKDCCKADMYFSSFDDIFSFIRSVKIAIRYMNVFALKNYPFIIKNTLRSLFSSIRKI